MSCPLKTEQERRVVMDSRSCSVLISFRLPVRLFLSDLPVPQNAPSQKASPSIVTDSGPGFRILLIENKNLS